MGSPRDYEHMGMDIPYIGDDTVDISSIDHAFTKNSLSYPVRGIFVYGGDNGNIKVEYYDDATTDTIPVVVPSSGFWELRGHLISKVFKTGTTVTGTIKGKW